MRLQAMIEQEDIQEMIDTMVTDSMNKVRLVTKVEPIVVEFEVEL